MINREWLHKLLVGERDGTVLWKIPLGEIDYEPVSDPAEGVAVATLAESILKVGLLQPLLLWRVKGEKSGVCYRLIAGRRRLEALRMLGKTHVSAIVVACKEEELPLLTLTDNFMRREPDPFSVAEHLDFLVSHGYTISRLSRLLGVPTSTVEGLLSIRALSADQQRQLKLCGAATEDAIALLQIPDGLRAMALQRAAVDDTTSIARLADEYRADPISSVLQCHKVWTADVKLFANTLRRSMRTMERAGFQCEVTHQESDSEISFAIRLHKSPIPDASDAKSAENVSRETSDDEECEQITLAIDEPAVTDIFRAIAEDERNERTMEGVRNVSRETLLHKNTYKGKRNQRENAEKLEFCIDEIGKR